MPTHRRKPVSASRARKTSRQVHDSTVGTHVARRTQGSHARRPAQGGSRRRRVPGFAESIARRARIRRIVAGVVAVVIVVAVAAVAGMLAFRGTVGGELTLKGSDAREALVAPRTGEPVYALVTAELGTVAAPLDNGGIDVVMLMRLDQEQRQVALVNLPAGLQVTVDNESRSLSSIAGEGDAALIRAVSAFAKVDIAHIVKFDETGVAGLVDALGGFRINLGQPIDDPHAGSIYLPAGEQLLDGEAALTYLRATNVKFGVEDQLSHQLEFAALALQKVLSREGVFPTRIESIAGQFQTDCTLADFEAVYSWLGGVSAGDVMRLVAPGYFKAVTNVTGAEGERYIASSADMVSLVEDLDAGREPSAGKLDEVETAQPGGFTVDVQNGTMIEGAAAAAAELLQDGGFTVGDVGNAEQPVYDETLVVYKGGDAGLARAQAVIEAVGAGRAVESNSYYSFAHDVLLIIGADNKPVA